jgi:predicted metal-dependent hydrolase
MRYPVSKIKGPDGDFYIVRDLKDKETAVKNLVKVRDECFRLKNIIIKEYPDDERTKRLIKNFTKERTSFSESTPDSQFTSHTRNKGEAIIFCLRQRDENENLVDMNTMMFVAIHEMGHVISKTVGHNDEFWNNFKWLLNIATKHNIYENVDYKNDPQEYCGMIITDNPAID